MELRAGVMGEAGRAFLPLPRDESINSALNCPGSSVSAAPVASAPAGRRVALINKPEDPRRAGLPLLARPAHLQGQTESQEGWGLPGGTESASPLGATAGAANAAQRPDAVDVSWVEQGSGGGTVITDGSREPGAAEVTGVMLVTDAGCAPGSAGTGARWLLFSGQPHAPHAGSLSAVRSDFQAVCLPGAPCVSSSGHSPDSGQFIDPEPLKEREAGSPKGKTWTRDPNYAVNLSPRSPKGACSQSPGRPRWNGK